MHEGKALDKWPLDADNAELLESNKLTASQDRRLATQWLGEAAKTIDVEMGVEYRGRLFEKTGLAKTADGSDDNLINVEVVEGKVSFTNVDSTPEPLKDVLPASYAPADEEHPPGANDEDDDSDDISKDIARLRKEAKGKPLPRYESKYFSPSSRRWFFKAKISSRIT